MKLIPIGQLLDRTWELYTQHFARFMRITLWLFLASIFYLISLFLAPDGRELAFLATQGLLNAGQIIGLIFSLTGMGVLYWLIRLWAQAEVVQTAQVVASGSTMTEKDVRKRTWKLAFPFLGLSIFRGMIFSLPLLVMVPMYFFSIMANLRENFAIWQALAELWAFFGSIGGLILVVLVGIWFWFAHFQLLLEGKTVFGSLKAAREIVRGRFFATLWRILLPKAIFGAVLIIVQVILFVLLALLLTNLPGLSNTVYNLIASIIGNLVIVGSLALTIPLFVCADYLVYDSLRQNQ